MLGGHAKRVLLECHISDSVECSVVKLALLVLGEITVDVLGPF